MYVFIENRELQLLTSRTTTGTAYIYSDPLEACNKFSQKRLLVTQACSKLMLGTHLICTNR